VTSTTDTTGHPDVAEISDLTEGLLSPSRSAEVRRHLDTCELCADVHASLEEIRGLLGSIPGPPRMPDDVAHRIDAALAAEALLHATTAEDTDTAEPDTVSASVTEPTSDTHVSRETSTAPARPAGRARTATTGPGRKERTRGGRRRVAVLGTVFAAAALGLGSVLVTSLTGGGGTSAEGGHATAADTFSESKLEQQVTDLLTKAQDSRSPDTLGIEGTTPDDGPRVLRHQPVPGCVQKGIDSSAEALATEKGTYHGKDALLVVLPDASDTTRVTVYLMDATCVKQSSAGPAKILLKDSYTRR
jgi:anti-sigma factor RsiW